MEQLNWVIIMINLYLLNYISVNEFENYEFYY
jgi:hypothetical protein